MKSLYYYYRYLWNKLVRRIEINDEPAFIVGCGHSGTSLLLAILGSHSRIYPVPGESRIAVKNDVQEFRKKVLEFNKHTIANGKKRWVEKTPKHIQHIEKILNWIPGAKIIIILRDGRDVAYSIKQRTGSLEEGTERWLADNLAGKAFWQHPNIHVVKYEQIISDFEVAITGVLSFLGESYEPELQDFHKKERKWYSNEILKPKHSSGDNHRQHRNWQINQPLFDGREKWRNLSEEELSVIYDEAGDFLAELGYVEK